MRHVPAIKMLVIGVKKIKMTKRKVLSKRLTIADNISLDDKDLSK